jgi:hypothetical protein
MHFYGTAPSFQPDDRFKNKKPCISARAVGQEGAWQLPGFNELLDDITFARTQHKMTHGDRQSLLHRCRHLLSPMGMRQCTN